MSDRTGGDLRIRSPIFLNCLSRGGSNIFWNLFLTHPDVCSPILETLSIFRADWRAPTRAGLWLALTSAQPRLFDQWYLGPRRALPASAARFIDRTLHRHQLRTIDDPEMRFKHDGELYTASEVENARLAAKNNNGLVFLNDRLREIYPDATFFALVRHPVPLYESHKRRRLWRTPEAFAAFYNAVTGKMLADAERFGDSHLTRFEDLLADPLATLRRLYGAAGLDFGKIRRIRLKSKEHFLADGSRGAAGDAGRHYWFDFDDVAAFLDPNINRHHVERLDPLESAAVRELTVAVRESLGYGDREEEGP